MRLEAGNAPEDGMDVTVVLWLSKVGRSNRCSYAIRMIALGTVSRRDGCGCCDEQEHDRG